MEISLQLYCLTTAMAPIYGIYDMACYRTIVMGGVVLIVLLKKKFYFACSIIFEKYPRASGLYEALLRGEVHCPSDTSPIAFVRRRPILLLFRRSPSFKRPTKDYLPIGIAIVAWSCCAPEMPGVGEI